MYHQKQRVLALLDSAKKASTPVHQPMGVEEAAFEQPSAGDYRQQSLLVGEGAKRPGLQDSPAETSAGAGRHSPEEKKSDDRQDGHVHLADVGHVVRAQGEPGVRHELLKFLELNYLGAIQLVEESQLEAGKKQQVKGQIEAAYLQAQAQINGLVDASVATLQEATAGARYAECKARNDIILDPCDEAAPLNTTWFGVFHAGHKQVCLPFQEAILFHVSDLEMEGFKPKLRTDVEKQQFFDGAKPGKRYDKDKRKAFFEKVVMPATHRRVASEPQAAIYGEWTDKPTAGGREEEKSAEVTHRILLDRVNLFTNTQLEKQGVITFGRGQLDQDLVIQILQQYDPTITEETDVAILQSSFRKFLDAMTDEEIVALGGADSVADLKRARLDGTTSHSRNAHHDEAKYQGASNVSALVKTVTIGGEEKVALQAMRRGSLIHYEIADKVSGLDRTRYLAAGILAQQQMLCTIATKAIQGWPPEKLAALTKGSSLSQVFTAENPLVVTDNYVQLISAIQWQDNQTQQMLDTATIYALLDGYEGPIRIGDQVIHIKAQLNMFSLGVNDFSATEHGQQELLNKQGLLHQRRQIVDYLKALQNEEGIKNTLNAAIVTKALTYLQAGEGSEEYQQIKGKLATKQASLHQVREAYFKLISSPDGLEANQERILALQKQAEALVVDIRGLEAKLESLHQKACSREGFRKELLNLIGSHDSTVPEQLRGFFNIMRLFIDAEELYYSGQWSDEDHLGEMQALLINLSSQLNQEGIGATLASFGCKSCMDRGEDVTVMAVGLGDAIVQDSAGVYRGLGTFDSHRAQKTWAAQGDDKAKKASYPDVGVCAQQDKGPAATYKRSCQAYVRSGAITANNDANANRAKGTYVLKHAPATAELTVIQKQKVAGRKKGGWKKLKRTGIVIGGFITGAFATVVAVLVSPFALSRTARSIAKAGWRSMKRDLASAWRVNPPYLEGTVSDTAYQEATLRVPHVVCDQRHAEDDGCARAVEVGRVPADTDGRLSSAARVAQLTLRGDDGREVSIASSHGDDIFAPSGEGNASEAGEQQGKATFSPFGGQSPKPPPVDVEQAEKGDEPYVSPFTLTSGGGGSDK